MPHARHGPQYADTGWCRKAWANNEQVPSCRALEIPRRRTNGSRQCWGWYRAYPSFDKHYDAKKKKSFIIDENGTTGSARRPFFFTVNSAASNLHPIHGCANPGDDDVFA